jgi:hypothetical protein
MKTSGFLIKLALVALVLGLYACSDTGGGDDGGGIRLPTDGSGGRLYYDLSSGEEVAPAGDNWDIALEAHDGAFFVLTNSGATATELGTAASGAGGVWFTGSTDFGAVTTAAQRIIPEADSEYEPYTQDAKRYTIVMAADPVEQTLNVITYLGYPTTGGYPPAGDGSGLSQENCFKRTDHTAVNMAVYVPYLFNKMQAYTMKGMPPNYTPTKQVYIVRHGDGLRYSKLQLSEVYLESGSQYHFVLHLSHMVVP